MTNTKSQKWGIFAVLLVTLAITLGAGKATQASGLPQQYTMAELKQAVRCGILAKASGRDSFDAQVFYDIIKPYVDNAEIAYEAGYTVGVLDAYGHLNAHKEGGFTLARIDIATEFYKLHECKANVSI